MRKELYNKLNFEERCCYRIEKNLDYTPSQFWFFLIAGSLFSMLNYLVEQPFAGLVVFTIAFTILVFILEAFESILISNKREKEWTNYVLEKEDENY